MRVLLVIVALLLSAAPAWSFSYATGGCATGGCAEGEDWLYTNANEVDAALDALEARDSIAEHESVETINVILETEMDASSELRALVDDESGTGALLFQGGDVGAATATTASANDNDTSVATTAFVQGEINGAGGTDLTCSGGSCDVDSGVTRDTEWDSIAELETATSADIVTSTEVFNYTISGSAPTADCTTGDLHLETATPALYGCTSTNTWEAL